MSFEKYDKLKAYLDPAVNIPESFFSPSHPEAESCIFMLSCLGKDQLLYLDETFQSLSGYSPEKLKQSGMDFWFSLMHPDDTEEVSKKIIESHQQLATDGFNEKDPVPLILTYRIKRANGQWVWIRDTKFLVSFSEKVIDKVLGKFEEILPEEIADGDLKKKLDEEKSCSKLLEFALIHQNDNQKKSLHVSDDENKKSASSLPQLTKREKEILQLIAEGLSSKMIADKCNISVNTVETHRRHLLEKLNVKNSMELVKEASKVYWL